MFKKLYLFSKNILLRFLHHFVDLAELILNIYILLGFDKIFNTIFYFTHTNSTNLLIMRIYFYIIMSTYSNLASISSAIEKLELEDTFHDQDEEITWCQEK